MTPEFEPVGCDNNIIEDNDGSYSPTNAFEAIFSRGNIFRSNIANYSNYGFWLGVSRDGILENN
jgi:parallel beta-helix repeat protein